MRVMKFGGSSLASPERLRVVTQLVLAAQKEEPVIIVVSAFQGVSNELFICANLAAEGDKSYQALYQQLAQRHYDTIQTLLPKHNQEIIQNVQQLLLELDEILQGIMLLREVTLGALDHIASFGERLSATILTAYINQFQASQYVDARKLIFTDNSHTHANVLVDQTYSAIQAYYQTLPNSHATIPIITGYIASTLDGKTTTLGRNSSDYTATILGAALGATRIEIWSDVDGVYSANPDIVDSAFIVSQLSLDEAIELSYFGAKILHPSTFIPLFDKNIPILIKNTLNPHSPGTLVSNQSDTKQKSKCIAKSISAIDDITLLIWKTHGDIEISAVTERLFKTLATANVNVLIILEGSPKHAICLGINTHQLEIAKRAIAREFHLEIGHRLVSIEEKSEQSIIAIIGDDMKMLSPDISGKMFQALGKLQININALIQGASDRSISLVIDSNQRTRAINLIHQSFFSDYKYLAIVVIGAGRIGTGLLQQIQKQQNALLDKKISLSVVGVTNSKKMLFNPNGIQLNHWQENLLSATEPLDLVKLSKMLAQVEYSNLAIVDCTASEAVVEAYPVFIQAGIHIITPNKRANVLPLSQWNKLMSDFKRHHCYFLCRTNVGAGLPILTVLDDLLACGDSIIKIEGILSGTLSYLFNHYNGTQLFSNVLKQAQDLTMTEPDPREDLSGIDVARKLLILARKMGWAMELSDVSIENLIPKELQSGPYTPQFFEDFKKYENEFKQKYLQAQANNKVLRYVGTLENHRASAQLKEIPRDHPLALSVHSDNIISFTTHHYHDTPLVIRGPGAGVECTALGVFSDILKLLSHLPS